MDETFEDMSLLEKTQYKLNQLKEEFLHLVLWQKIALLIAGSILCSILFYTFFTVTKLAQIKKSSYPNPQSDTSNTSVTAKNSGLKEDTNSQTQTNSVMLNDNPSSPSATGSETQTPGDIIGFIQNLLGNNQSTSNSSSQKSTTITTGASGISGSTGTQSQQSGSVLTQPYIVNFLNGLLYFQDPKTGEVTPYILSGVNPSDYAWARYTNPTDGYSIEYPTNWQMIKRSDNGHEGLSLYPPEEDPADNDAKQIGLGWSPQYLLPTAGGAEIYYQTSITISNTLGQLYTLGGGDQGNKGIALLIPHRFGYFGLGGMADTSEFIYVFQHMLSSLTLTK